LQLPSYRHRVDNKFLKLRSQKFQRQTRPALPRRQQRRGDDG
jgi:hypothetical protein